MLAVKGIYDGKVAVPDQPVSITGRRQEVIITFLEPVHTQAAGDNPAFITANANESPAEKLKRIQEKRAILESLVGICADIPLSLDEIRAERLARQ
jgi:hypothetical protein